MLTTCDIGTCPQLARKQIWVPPFVLLVCNHHPDVEAQAVSEEEEG